ncbi:TPA: ABC transporter ATP-binding protein [Raoultella planticola]|jgi:branched-chain amino acid transport system ATP-binding protein|uniref:LIV-I protein F n=1 Tax=Raoultella planticola TaxID=575 RepID=A0A485DBH5_RAOPL|nr:ABC transporter ATP-binding protein [Raoultella planticola]AUU05056.1 ABC transporter ATP-binding protein [Raoultella planticola]ELT9605430.1 ABC transporter ATP-binding protein [Raoultella planticola]KFD02861.1 branched-chain amino acid transport ATP-binding protein [Raoultella planticola ATCC 33531]MCD9607582.1 ABC transporter ATP-binding protein [Raoultella planticola]OZP71665.1 ABC transporter ATP-binding protein [Raoultella planticola]
MSDLLTVTGLSVHYGGIQAVRDVSFSVQAGEQATLIGANGAGKSSTVRAITGLEPFSGEILFNGKAVRRRKAESLLREGLVMVPEGRGIFTRMTVLENLQMGAWLRRDSAAVRQEMAEIFANFPRLAERQHQLAGLLSGGEQQLLALNRALLSQPRLLILDEPSMGLAPLMVENVFRVIATLRQRGVALLLIEQNARLALEATDSAWVMDSGSIVERGASQALLADDRIAQIYLGEVPA